MYGRMQKDSSSSSIEDRKINQHKIESRKTRVKIKKKTSIKRHSDEIIHANRKLDHSLINPEIQRMKYVCTAPVELFVIYLYVGFGALGTKQYKS